MREKELCLSACMCVCVFSSGAKAVWMDGHVTASPHRMHIFFNLVFFPFNYKEAVDSIVNVSSILKGHGFMN